MLINSRPRDRHAARSRRRARTGSRARRRLAGLAAAVPVGLLVTGTLVWHTSSAAFVATTDNPGDSWETGVVRLTSDRSATALFTTATEGLLVPGSSGYKCITVTYTGSVDTAATGVRLYGALTTDSAELADALEVTVQMSTTALSPAPDADCDPAFQASPVSYPDTALSDFPGDYATGIGDANGDGAGDWRPTATTDRSRTYKISYRLPAGSYPSSVQGKTVGMTFTWEVQSGTPSS
jgi:hypothetical protein